MPVPVQTEPTPVQRPITHAVFAPDGAAAYGATAGAYTVQVGAYYTEDNARQVANKVSRIGHATIDKEGDLYKVRIKNMSAEDAKRVMERLRSEENIKPGLIKNGRWQPR